jgi:hypothetical protein
MLYPELIVREILENTKQAKYGNVDLGAKENISRGAAVSGLQKSLNNGFSVWITFLPDTLHNRSVLLQKRGVVVLIMGESGSYIELSSSWIETLFGDLEAAAAATTKPIAPNADANFVHRGENLEDSVRIAQGATVSSGMQTNIRATPPAAEPTKGKRGRPKASEPAPAVTEIAMEAPAMPAAEADEIASFQDFVALGKEGQLRALMGDVPLALLQEIVGHSGPGIDTEVIETAFMKLNV